MNTTNNNDDDDDDDDDNDLFIWTGDMWESSTDGIKAHDIQYWSPIVWKYDPVSGIDLPMKFYWLDNFTIDIPI